MALIRCPECGEFISDKATVCIKCGYPIKELASKQAPIIDGSAENQLEEDSVAETVLLEGFSLDDESISEKQESMKQPTPSDIKQEAVIEDGLCTVDVPKAKYVMWLFILSLVSSCAYKIGYLISKGYGQYITVSYVVGYLLPILPGIALICNAKGKKLPARICAAAYAAIAIALTVFDTVVYQGYFDISYYVPIIGYIYLVIYVFQSAEKQESKLWFILGCIIVPLDTILPIIFGWHYYDNMVIQTLVRVVSVIGCAYYLVGYCPKCWFNKYQIPKKTKKAVLIGRLAALGTGIISVIVQVIGCVGVSSEEYRDAVWSYQLSTYDYSKQSRLEKFLRPISDQYYRNNTISIILACIASVLFIVTLVIVHKKKRVCKE